MGFHQCPKTASLFALPSAQFEALFHSRDRRGGSRQDFLPFPQQLLFCAPGLHLVGGCLRTLIVGPWGGPCRGNLSVKSPLVYGATGFCVLLLSHIQTLPIC